MKPKIELKIGFKNWLRSVGFKHSSGDWWEHKEFGMVNMYDNQDDLSVMRAICKNKRNSALIEVHLIKIGNYIFIKPK